MTVRLQILSEHMPKLPPWFKQEIPQDIALSWMRLLSEFNVNTVCIAARCPNLSYCFKNSRLTFMILGDTCTRNCRFCAVNKSEDKSLALDWQEPYRIAEAVKKLGLRYAVITSVTRDDLKDKGAGLFAKTIELIRAIDKEIKVEALIPDFSGSLISLKAVVDARPCVIAHNLETVERLYKEVRPRADYGASLGVLSKIKALSSVLTTKSSLILGMGETEAEVIEAMRHLKGCYCDILTLGQYLAPTPQHYPVKEFISIEQFQRYRDIGLNLGFKSVLSGPLVRSSYQAEKTYREFAYA